MAADRKGVAVVVNVNRGLDLTGNVIQKKKALYYGVCRLQGKGSDGWLTGFKKRCKIAHVVDCPFNKN